MHRRLLEALVCPACHAGLRLVETLSDGEAVTAGHLCCIECGADYSIEDGIGHLGDSESLHQVADWLPEGLLTDELIRRNATGEGKRYQSSPPYAKWVDAIADTTGLIVDIATGPGGSMLGALMPRLRPSSHLVAVDAAASTMRMLGRYWGSQPQSRMMDFVVGDANHLPFGTASVDVITSVGGFENVRVDRRLRRPGRGEAYVEADRVLKTGGLIFDTTTVYGVGSETAAALSANGDPFGSRETLQELWSSLALTVQSVEVVSHGRGKVHPLDGLPLSDDDEWEALQWVLHKQ